MSGFQVSSYGLAWFHSHSSLCLCFHRCMKRGLWFITGNDTGVGKTVLTALLARWLQCRGRRVIAFKPVSSGSRADARALRAALGNELPLAEINPWHFRVPIAPLLAARREGRQVTRREIVTHVRRVWNSVIPPVAKLGTTRGKLNSPQIVLVEGAGGLLSPLGEGFDSRGLIQALGAMPIVVCQNRLGAVNQALLVIEALPTRFQQSAPVVLMSPRRRDAASLSNARLLGELIGEDRVHVLPWLGAAWNSAGTLQRTAVQRSLVRLVDCLEP